jgi:hypothetical protein
VLLQTQPDKGERNVHKRSWNGDGNETNGHNGACTAATSGPSALPLYWLYLAVKTMPITTRALKYVSVEWRPQRDFVFVVAGLSVIGDVQQGPEQSLLETWAAREVTL